MSLEKRGSTIYEYVFIIVHSILVEFDSFIVYVFNDLQQSAETLLVTLFKEFRNSTQVLLSLVKEYEAPVADSQDRAIILAKDALYNAVGITAYELYDEVCLWFKLVLTDYLILFIYLCIVCFRRMAGQHLGSRISSPCANTSSVRYFINERESKSFSFYNI